MTSVRSRQRVADHGEVFTPTWMVQAMLDGVKGESERIDSRFLEPACGSGNFLVDVLRRKLVTVDLKFGGSDFERRHYGLFAVMCVYGVELLPDNVEECRANVTEVFAQWLGGDGTDEAHTAAAYVLTQNVVHGDAVTMLDVAGDPITFAEWGYLGRGRFQRRDFRYDSLVQMSSLGEDTLFGSLGGHEIFMPVRSYPAQTLSDLGR